MIAPRRHTPGARVKSAAVIACGQSRPRKPAFTLLEIMLALALSGVVVLASMSLIWMVQSADKRLSSQFDDQIQFSETQRILRRALATLIAARPEEPAPNPNNGQSPEDLEDNGDVEEDSGLSPEQRAAREQLAALVAQLGADDALIRTLLENDGSQYANFELFHELSPSGRALPRLALTLMRPPVAPPQIFEDSIPVAIAGDKIRGSFDLHEVGQTLTLVWQPLDPPGLPLTIARDLLWAEWWVLPRRKYGLEWVDVYAAFIEERYPVAVRISLWTASGSHVDWLFETAVTTP